ncbi:hypothetical protein Bca52824_024431, partial [Brassica carinata]
IIILGQLKTSNSSSLTEKPLCFSSFQICLLDKISCKVSSLRTKMEEQTIEGMLKKLTKIDIDLVCTGEKLMHMFILLMHLLASDNDTEGVGRVDSSAASFEKALTYDLLCGIWESELKEVDMVLDEVEAQIVDASKLSTYKYVRDIFMIDRLGGCAQYLKQSRGRVSEITLKLAQLQRTIGYIRNDTNVCLESCIQKVG